MSSPSPFRKTLATLLLMAALPCALCAQQRAALITSPLSAQTPYRYSGRLLVAQGDTDFLGTATAIRRFTGLTAAHLLYDPASGFSSEVVFQPDFFSTLLPGRQTGIATFAVLSGYQSAANADGDSDLAFSRDLGYVLFINPALSNDWADWQANPDGSAGLLGNSAKLVLGYAADTFPGDVLAFVNTSAPFSLLLEGLYESPDYYTQSGMSGGPVYLLVDGSWKVVAEVVAGTNPPRQAFSDVRAITAAERPLLIDAEYRQGIVSGGFITGPATVSFGATAVYKTGVIFQDRVREGKGGLPVRYTEVKLIAAGPNKRAVSIQQVKPGKYQINFGTLAKGSQVELRLIRDTAKNRDQAPLEQLFVTVQ
jgi:V8-like Glu-specific endopeptidase